MAKDRPLERVGDYEFLDRLAVGGMGELWRVRHVTLGATYVAKLLRPEYREDKEFVQRFLREARLVANLRHPNIVQVFGYDAEHSLILMEYVEGLDLDALLRSKWDLAFREKRCIAEVVAETIGYAHREHNLIHRDIKPSNVLIAMSTPGEPIRRSRIKLTDFGIARVLSVNQRMTMASGMVMGTVHYMAPEQFQGEADKASDVYSIGVLYYRLLTGRVPFDGPTPFVIRDKHLQQVPHPPIEIKPDVPEADSQIVMKCLAKRPEDRFRDGAELYEALLAGTTEPIEGAGVDLHAVTQVLPSEGGAAPPRTDVTRPTDLVEPTEKIVTGAAGPPRQPPPPDVPGDVTERTIPSTPGPRAPEAPPGEPVTEATLGAPRTAEKEEAEPRRRRRWRIVAAAAVGVVALAVLGAVVLRPRYTIRWNTLRPDPLDTPKGIRVAVRPHLLAGPFWRPLGTVTEEDAPEDWTSGITALGGVDVRLSDGLYREFAVTCRQPEDGSTVDFGGATFEQVAEAHGARVVEDLSRAGDYINAVLVPENVSRVHCLADLRRCLDRVEDLLGRAKDVEFDRTRGETYRGALGGLLQAAEALADSRQDEAEAAFRKAQVHLQQIDPGQLGELPEDFLFRHTLGQAIAELKRRAEKADRLTAALQPAADSPATVDYTTERFAEAGGAVARYLFFAPGRTAFQAIAADSDGVPETLEERVDALDKGAPPPIVTARRYLAKLDALVEHKPPAEAAGPFHATVLCFLDDALTAALAPQRAAWLEKCFAREDLRFVDLAQAYWEQAHRARFQAAAKRCRAYAAQEATAAAPLPADPKRLADAEEHLARACACLDALRKAAHASEEAKSAAASQLSTCCVRRALCLFRLGPRSSADEEQHLAAVRKLLDRGLNDLGGADPDTVRLGDGLRRLLTLSADARARLAVCRRENFGTRGACEGKVGPLFAALEAYERLEEKWRPLADHPGFEAARRPFVRVDAAACEGFTLPNAVAWWLLAKAGEHCEAGEYREAGQLLDRFAHVPAPGGARGESPLKRLLAPPLRARAEKLAALAQAFDETAAPAETARAAERWKGLWDRRLQAKPLLDITIPATVTPSDLPPGHEGQAEQWNILHGRMHALLDHYRTRLHAEEQLRAIASTVASLRAQPQALRPDAIHQCATSLQQLRTDEGFRDLEDHPARAAELARQVQALQSAVADAGQRVADLLDRGDPKGALDQLHTHRRLLDDATELRLTRQALEAWAKQAQAALDRDDVAAATAQLKALTQHEQARQHAESPGVKGTLATARRALLYCQGRSALAQGAKGFAEARAKLQQAGTIRDAERIVRQLATFDAAAKLQAEKPFQALARLAELAKDATLHPAVRAAAEAGLEDTRTALVGQAAACTQAFHQGLATGRWEQFLDTERILETELARLRTFLAHAEALEVQELKPPQAVEVQPDQGRVKFTSARALQFRYKLPDGESLPLTVEQSIEWTVRYVPREEMKDQRWLVVDWMEAP